MLYFTNIVNIQSFMILFIFTMISFADINRNDFFLKRIFLICNFLSFLSFTIFFLFIVSIDSISEISKILQFTLIIISFSYFSMCLMNFNFIRLRILYIPYLLLFYIVTYLSFYILPDDNYSKNIIFSNDLLLIHIILSLLSYSLLTFSVLTSISVFLLEKNLKLTDKKNIKFISMFPSLFESEKITLRLLYGTIILLLFSFISGFFYSLNIENFKIFFLNEKTILSIITFFLIMIILIRRRFFGITGKKIFSLVLTSFLIINFAYFGLKFLELV